MIKILNENENLEDVIKNGKYIVDFYADWCGPCKMLAPVLESITEVDVIKVNVDNHQMLANKYGVMSIPTIIYFDNGKEIKKEIGFKSKEQILDMIK